jgi:hypothetical protein
VGDKAMPEKAPAKKEFPRTKNRTAAKNWSISKATEDLIYNGCYDNRNRRSFAAACELLEKGVAAADAYAMVFQNIPTCEDFNDSEKKAIIRSAEKRIQKN